MTAKKIFKYFKTSPEIIRLAVMYYVRFPQSLWNVDDLLHERGIGVSYEVVRFWWNRWPDVCCRDPKETYPKTASILKLAVASG